MDEVAELAALVRCAAHGLVIVANNSLSDESGEVVVITPANALHGEGDMGRRNGIVAYAQIRSNETGLSLGEPVGRAVGRAGREAGEVLLCELNQLLVRNATSANQHHAVRSVVGLDVIDELSAGDVTDVVPWSEDRATQGLMLIGGRVEVVEDNLVHLLLDLLGLTQDHVTFSFDRTRLELGVL
jgi:hypothetical protein